MFKGLMQVCSQKTQIDLKMLISYVFLVAERALHYFLSQKGLCFNITLYVTKISLNSSMAVFINSGQMVICTRSGMKIMVLPWYRFLPSCWLILSFQIFSNGWWRQTENHAEFGGACWTNKFRYTVTWTVWKGSVYCWNVS